MIGKMLGHYQITSQLTPWDMSYDGKRFVMTKRSRPANGGSTEKRPGKMIIHACFLQGNSVQPDNCPLPKVENRHAPCHTIGELR